MIGEEERERTDYANDSAIISAIPREIDGEPGRQPISSTISVDVFYRRAERLVLEVREDGYLALACLVLDESARYRRRRARCCRAVP
jgi:hypothetical protein